jgi:hypothetical protein
MNKETSTRVGISLTAEDKLAIRRAKAKLKAEHGKLTTSAVIRIAVRRLSQ